jgi:hypothetical protein
MDIALSEALVPVLRDLGTRGAPVPDVRAKQWPDFPGQVTAMRHDTEVPGASWRIRRCWPGIQVPQLFWQDIWRG